MKAINKVLRFIVRLFLGTLIIGLVWMNVRLYHQPEFKTVEGESINLDLFYQLSFLKQRLHSGEGKKMQLLFPEGFIFIHSLYGLSWSNFLMSFETDTSNWRWRFQLGTLLILGLLSFLFFKL